MKRLLVSLSFALMACAAHALPSVADVQAEVQKGHYAQAQTMMHDVVAAKPGSAKAHYIYAEILAHNGRFDEAAAEAQQAQQIEPSLAFTQPEKFKAFQQSLDRARQGGTPRTGSGDGSLDKLGPSSAAQREARQAQVQAQAPATAPQETQTSRAGLPGWVIPVGLLVLLVIGWRMFSKSRGPAAAGPGAMGGAAPGAVNPYGPGAGPNYGAAAGAGAAYGPGYRPGNPGMAPGGMMGGGARSGMMGAGLAAAGGLAAGVLAEKYLERGREGGRDPNPVAENDRSAGGAYPAPALNDDGRALENRDVDFGNGNGNDNDWSNDDAGSGGSFDTGGGSDDQGW